MEYLDIVDENGTPTGGIIDRKTAHQKGVRHRTSHVWIARREKGKIQILLQKRCRTKDSFPGCYDISSAGHIPAGVDYIPSALRELEEELGVRIREDQLIDCGLRRVNVKTEFYGECFIDAQVSRVFLLWLDMEESEFAVQESEIESVRWMDFEECKAAVRENRIPNCIAMEELEMLEKHF